MYHPQLEHHHWSQASPNPSPSSEQGEGKGQQGQELSEEEGTKPIGFESLEWELI
jgi:hypothetical protein